MLSLISRRLLQLPLIVMVIYTITMALAWLVPGNPLEKGEGRRPPAEVVEAMKKQYNLDSFSNFYSSYLYNASGSRWLYEHLLTDRASRSEQEALAAGQAPAYRAVFDFGPSLQYEDWRVNDILSQSLPVSIALGLIAILLALILGVVAGVIGAVRPNSLIDLATLSIALVGISLPSFVIGTGLVMLFAVWTPLAPIGGWGTLASIPLPAITLALPFAAYIARLTRMGMVEHLQADFIRTARAKGVSQASILLKHALKNAFLPVLSFLGPAAALAMTGSFVVERVFFIPGMGQHFVNAVLNKDLFLIMGVVLIYSTMLILFNLLVDVLYRWIDPRIQ